jgi:RHS repeat-associated protein
MKSTRFRKVVSVVVSGALVINCGGSGIAAATVSLFSLVQEQGELLPPFSERPGPEYLGARPGRDLESRGGVYSERARRNIAHAEEKWAGPFGGIVAGNSPAKSLFLPSYGGGSGMPGEGTTGGFTGGGIINTLYGNLMKAYTLLAWPSVGELEFAFTVCYNNLSSYDVELGQNWIFNFGAKLDVNAGDVTILWGDGTVNTFDYQGPGAYDAQPGCFDKLELLGNGHYQVTTNDLIEFEFTTPNGSILNDPGDLVAIRDRNGNQITITVSTVSTTSGNVERAIRAEDAISGRYVDIDYDSNGRIYQVSDHKAPSARVWTFAYDGGDLQAITYPQINGNTYSRTFEITGGVMDYEDDLRGNRWNYSYDGSGRISATTNPLGKSITYDYQPTYTKIIYPGGKFEKHNYSSGKLASKMDENNFSVAYRSYNADFLVTDFADKRSKIWTFTYNSKGSLLTRTDPLNHTTSYAYESNNDLDTVTDAEGGVWNYNYYTTGAKLLEKVIDPEGRTLATYTYNSAGDVATITDGENNTTTIGYGSDGYPDTVTDPYSKTTHFHRDAFGRVDWVEDPIQAATGSTADRTDIAYDEWCRQVTVTHPPKALGQPRYTTQFQYDPGDSLTLITDERGETVSYAYDAAGQLTDTTNQEAETKHIDYTDRGWVWKITNGRGKVREYVYTDRGDLYMYKLPLGGINKEGENWSYDGNGNATGHAYFLSGFSNQSESKFYTYDNANRLTVVDYATLAMTNVTFDYDDADRLIEMIDATGTTEWFYDADGQANKMTSPQGTMEYDYYSATGKLQYLTEIVTGGNITTTYTYDDAGRTETIDKFGETTTFVYDDASRPEKMFYYTGAYAKYTYDGRSRITAVEHFNSSNALLRKETNTYDEASRITARYEGPTIGGVTTTFGYDDIGQLTSESASGYSASYAYDDNGNRTTRVLNGVTETYDYDDADKLTSVTYSDSTPTKTYAYHYSGRCTGIAQGGVTTTLNYDKESRVTGISRPGSLTASYVYNGFDARISKTVGSNTTTFKRAGAGATAPLISDTAGTTTTGHVPGISSKVGSTSTFAHAGIKNGILQTNAFQSNTGTKRYDAFGNQLNTTGTWQTAFSYGAALDYQSDSEYGLQLLGHRYYDSSTGRFLSRDLIKSGRNWYAYCENNPTGFGDPNGLWTISIFGSDYEFNSDVISSGLETGGAAVLSAASDMLAGAANAPFEAFPPFQILGVPGPFHGWDGGAYKDEPGWDVAKGSAIVGLTAASLAWGMGGGPRGSCFVAGTQIAMADGTTKPIEDIEAGDKVLSRDQFAKSSSKAVAAEVTRTFKREVSTTLIVTLDAGSTVETTPEHWIYADGKGFVPAGTLTPDDRIAVAKGRLADVASIRLTPKNATVYNFEVANTHTYFVRAGESKLWVHNLPCDAPASSKIWKALKNFRGKVKTNGVGKKRRFYRWDYTHGDIEVFDRHGKHLGTIDPETGDFIKPGVSGRTLD